MRPYKKKERFIAQERRDGEEVLTGRGDWGAAVPSMRSLRQAQGKRNDGLGRASMPEFPTGAGTGATCPPAATHILRAGTAWFGYAHHKCRAPTRRREIPRFAPFDYGQGKRNDGVGRGAERKRDFSHPQADAFARANAEEKSRPAGFEMTGGWRGRPDEAGMLCSE